MYPREPGAYGGAGASGGGDHLYGEGVAVGSMFFACAPVGIPESGDGRGGGGGSCAAGDLVEWKGSLER
jgi:hypothetical protein